MIRKAVFLDRDGTMDPVFSGNLAIFCSDERFIESTLSFLRNSLEIKKSALMTVPGGPAFIANNESNLLDRLGILVETHNISQMILVAHFDCGYYKVITGNSSKEKILKKQLDDIQESVHKLKKLFRDIVIKAFYARVYNSKIIKYIQIKVD
jgi:hypothetical protein